MFSLDVECGSSVSATIGHWLSGPQVSVLSRVSTLEEVTCVTCAPGPSAATKTSNNMIIVIVSLLSLRKGLKI